MHTSLAGLLPLKDTISQVLENARVKLAAAEEPKSEKVKKLLAAEKKEHGGKTPTPKEEEEEHDEHEKNSSAIDVSDFTQVEKLASALDFVGDQLLKEAADAAFQGGESRQGGKTIPVATPITGSQPYKHDASKTGKIPANAGKQSDPSQGPTATQVANNAASPPGRAVKTAATRFEEVVRKMANEKKGVEDAKARAKEDQEDKKEDKKEDAKDKKASPLDYLLSKMAESAQGGKTLDSPSGEGPKPPADSAGGNEARKALESNEAAINMKRIDGKRPQKRMLAQYLSEPAMSRSTDSKVHENLPSAPKSGVKIAAARVLLQKIAQEGCKCSNAGDCQYCKMKVAMASKSKERSATSGAV